MKNLLSIAMILTSCIACTDAQTSDVPNVGQNTKKVLVAFFSRTGENYAVGTIEKGNTHCLAEIIAAQTKGQLFEIKPAKAYPDVYDECTALAKKEKESKARPEVTSDIDIEDYDVIFLGYPNWWSDLPMPVYTFIEKHVWEGKTVIPFCTHEGSGLSDTEAAIKSACAGATVLKGLAMKGSVAQKEPDKAAQSVTAWLEKIKF